MRETVKLGVRLMLFALVAGLLLAVVNAVTEEAPPWIIVVTLSK